MKGQVKWPRQRLRNALLLHFLSNPYTTSTDVSCVCDKSSETSDSKDHIDSNHGVQDFVNEDDIINSVEAQVLSTR